MRLSNLEKEVADLKAKNSLLAADNKKLTDEKEEAVEASFHEGVCSYI